VIRRLERYADPRGFSLLVPAGWKQVVDPRTDIAFLAIDSVPAANFCANVILTTDDLPPDLDLDDWQSHAGAMLESMLAGYLLLDQERLDRPGGPIIRRLVHHVVAQSEPVTAEQWTSLHGRTGYTLTCSAATLAYDDVADILTEVGHSWRLAS